MSTEQEAKPRELRSIDTSWDILAGKAIGDEFLPAPAPHLAENLGVIFACVQAISETLAMLPLRVYREDDAGVRTVESSHPLARLFSRQPNPRQTVFEFIEMQTSACLLRGNSFALIIRDGRGSVTELWPIHPDNVSILKVTGSRRINYQVTDPDTGGTQRFLAEQILHLRDRSDDGIVGRSRLSRARDTLAIAHATEQFAAATFRNQAKLSGVLEHPGRMDDEPFRRLQSQFEKTYTGIGNAGRVPVLEEGVKFHEVSVSPQDAEILASRRLSVESLARIYRVPLPLIGVTEGGASYSSVQELHRMFQAHAIMPWARRWEAVINATLLSEESRRNTFVEMDLDEISRSNLLERWQSYRIAREVGAANANEIRKWERLNPRTDPDGETYLSPLNMQSEQKGKAKEV